MTLQLQDGVWEITGHDCNARTSGVPPLASLARESAQRLVPRLSIGVGPPGGVTLVNIQTLFWLDTSATRSLGTVRLLGQSVELRVTIESVAWDFGDGQTDRTSDGGTPYSPDQPCNTVLCPGYFGHVYTATGTRTVTATSTWAGSYRIGSGTWQPIANTVTGPPSSLTLSVKQARGILVPNPN